MNRTALIFLASVTTVGMLCIAGTADYQQEIADEEEYCRMVFLFENSTLPKLQRPGWPPYRDDIDCAEHGFSLAQNFSNHDRSFTQ